MKVSIIGLGYVGLPLAISFARENLNVVGVDINKKRIEELKRGIDKNKEVSKEELDKYIGNITFTTDFSKTEGSDFFIITVPTPITKNKVPDLRYIKESAETISKFVKKGAIVVLESTVYPGVTEEIIGKIIEEKSGLKMGVDFKLAYSPERVNPGDKKHSLRNIVKVIGAQDEETAKKVEALYKKIVKEVFVAKDIKTAEASKMVENIQRDINIALINELAILFNKMGLSIWDILDAASTKWNFLKFKPGLVGGHCISVDPYYLIYKGEEIEYRPRIVSAGREINNAMVDYLLQNIIKALNEYRIPMKGSKILFLGITFKENVPDMRNSLNYKFSKILEEYGSIVHRIDPLAEIEDKGVFRKLEGSIEEEYDVAIFAVPHKEFLENKEKILGIRTKVFVDIKGVFRKEKGLWKKYISF